MWQYLAGLLARAGSSPQLRWHSQRMHVRREVRNHRTAAANVVRNCWVQPQGLVDRMSQVRQVFEIFVGRSSSWADLFQNLLTKLLPDVGIICKLIHSPGERCRGCISTSDQYSKNLIPDDLRISRKQGNVVQECELLVRLGKLLELLKGQTQR